MDEVIICLCAPVFGTITVRFDSTEGLAADALYRREIDAYSRRTQLPLGSLRACKRTLSTLAKVAKG